MIYGLTLSVMLAVTAAALAQPAASSSAHFTASPISGRAPLTVTFCASAGIDIDFGDGTSSGLGPPPKDACPAGENSYTTHTYTAAGIYRLRGFPCPSADSDICGRVAEQAGAVTITVTAGP